LSFSQQSLHYLISLFKGGDYPRDERVIVASFQGMRERRLLSFR
jgi:hypothetical protein